MLSFVAGTLGETLLVPVQINNFIVPLFLFILPETEAAYTLASYGKLAVLVAFWELHSCSSVNVSACQQSGRKRLPDLVSLRREP